METPPNLLLADRNSPANQWLRENPLVLAAGMCFLGLVLLYFGVVGLRSGTTKDKFGNELRGGMATLSSVIRVVAGIGLICMAGYLSIFGAW
jgi:hypothetical protein